VKVLVTGGAGYIGSVTAARLIEAGHAVTVLDDLSTGHADAVPAGARFVHGRVHDAAELLGAELASFDGAVHLAAASLVAESVENPGKYQENNVVGSDRLIDALARAGVGRIVFSSTAAVYGEPECVPIDEDAPCRPVNPYGESKLAIDHLLGDVAERSRLATVSLRYFNVAGAYAGLGERHRQESHLIPIALQAALGQRGDMVIFGEDYPTPDGTCVRDYIHVADIAAAHLLALEHARPGVHLICNLGNGSGYSVREVLATVEQVTGRVLDVRVAGRRAGDPAVLVASAARARRELGWVPERPELSVMVADAWKLVAAKGAR
jgi:UDP-glucose 4-epimerase